MIKDHVIQGGKNLVLLFCRQAKGGLDLPQLNSHFQSGGAGSLFLLVDRVLRPLLWGEQRFDLLLRIPQYLAISIQLFYGGLALLHVLIAGHSRL